MGNVTAAEFLKLPSGKNFKDEVDSFWSENPDKKPNDPRPGTILFEALKDAAGNLDADAELQVPVAGVKSSNLPRLNHRLSAYAEAHGHDRAMHVVKRGDAYKVLWQDTGLGNVTSLMTLLLKFASAKDYENCGDLVSCFEEENSKLSLKKCDVVQIDEQSCAIPFLMQDSSQHYSESLSTLIRRCLEHGLISRRVFASIAIERTKADQFEPRTFLNQKSYKVAKDRLNAFEEFSKVFRPGMDMGFITTGLDEIRLVLPDFIFDHVRDRNMELINVLSDWRPIGATDEQLKEAVVEIPELETGQYIACCENSAEEDVWRHLLGRWARKKDSDSLILFWECHESRTEELMFPIHECFRRLTGVGFGNDEESAFDSHSKRLYRWLRTNINSSINEFLHILEIFLLRKSPVEPAFIRKLGSFFTSLVAELARKRKIFIVVNGVAHADEATVDLINSLRNVSDIMILGIKQRTEECHRNLVEPPPISISPKLHSLIQEMTGQYDSIELDDDEKLVLKIALTLEWNFLRSWIRKIWVELNGDRFQNADAAKVDCERVINSLIQKKILRPSGQLKDYGANLIYRELRFFGNQSYEHFEQTIQIENDEAQKISARFLGLLKEYIKNTCNAQKIRQKFQVVRYLERIRNTGLGKNEQSDFAEISDHLPAICNVVARRFMGYSPDLIVDRLRLAIDQPLNRIGQINQQAESLILCLDNMPLKYDVRQRVFEKSRECIEQLKGSSAENDFLRFRLQRSLANWKLRNRDFAEAKALEAEIEETGQQIQAVHVLQDLRHSVIYMKHMQNVLQKRLSECIRVERLDPSDSYKSAFYARSRILESLAFFSVDHKLSEPVRIAAEEAKQLARDDSTRHFVAAIHGLIFIAAGQVDLARERCYDEIIHTGPFSAQWELFSQQMFLAASLIGFGSGSLKQDSQTETIYDYGDIFEEIQDPEFAVESIRGTLFELMSRFQRISSVGLKFFNEICRNHSVDWQALDVEDRLEIINKLFGEECQPDEPGHDLKKPNYMKQSKSSRFEDS